MCSRAPIASTTQPSPAPRIMCLVPAGRWTKSHCRSGRSCPSTSSSASPERTRYASWVGLPVGHPDRLARPEQRQVRAEAAEVGLALLVRRAGERDAVAAPLAVPPARLARPEDEPPRPDRPEPVLGALARRLGPHLPIGSR